MKLRHSKPALSVLLGLALAVLLPSLVRAHGEHTALPSKGAVVRGNEIVLSKAAQKAVGLTLVKLQRGKLHEQVRLNARVELPWRHEALVTTLVPGRISEVLVQPGEAVEAGQELARVESLELETLQLEMLEALAQQQLAQRWVEQRQTLAAGGAVAGKTLQEAQAEVEHATAELEFALRKLHLLGLDDATLEEVQKTGQPINSLAIRSPIAGVVQHADVRVGQVVATTEHLYDIVDLGRVWLVGELLEADSARIRPGQPVGVTFAALPGQSFAGQVEHVRLKIDPAKRTYGVVVSVDNDDNHLRPGMSGRMEIEVSGSADALLAPTDAVVKTPQGDFLLVEHEQGVYERQPVRLGMRAGKQVEVLEGVRSGQRVVALGSRILASLFNKAGEHDHDDGDHDHDHGNHGHADHDHDHGDAKRHHGRHKHGDRAAPRHSHSRPVEPTRSPARAAPAQSSPGAAAPLSVVAQGQFELPASAKHYGSSQLEGRVIRVLVEPGQRVEAGQVLAEVDSLELRTLQLDLLHARSRLQWIERSLERLRPLVARGSTARSRLWELETEETRLRSKLESLARKLRAIGVSEEELQRIVAAGLSHSHSAAELGVVPIRAPAAGRIAALEVVLGQVVRPEDRLFEIHDLAQLWVKAHIYEPEASQVRVGQKAEIMVPALDGRTLAGHVVRAAPTLDSGHRVLPVWIDLEDSDEQLKEGMLATARIAVGTPDLAADRHEAIRPKQPPRQPAGAARPDSTRSAAAR